MYILTAHVSDQGLAGEGCIDWRQDGIVPADINHGRRTSKDARRRQPKHLCNGDDVHLDPTCKLSTPSLCAFSFSLEADAEIDFAVSSGPRIQQSPRQISRATSTAFQPAISPKD
jgi:hypothetical protein